MKKKLLCLTVCGMLILTMAACGSSREEGEADNGTEVTSEAVAEETTVQADT